MDVSDANPNVAESHVALLPRRTHFLHRSTSRLGFTMTEEASSASVRSSQGSHKRAPKNVSLPSARMSNVGPSEPDCSS